MIIEKFREERRGRERERERERERKRESFVIDYIKFLSISVNAECRRRL